MLREVHPTPDAVWRPPTYQAARPLSTFDPDDGPLTLLDGLLYDDSLTLLVGREGSGKTTLAANIAAAVTAPKRDALGHGRWCGRYLAHDGGVLWLWCEGDPAKLRQDVEAAGGDASRVDMVRLSVMEDGADLRAAVRATDPSLVIVDTYADMVGAVSPYDLGAAREQIRDWHVSRPVLGLAHATKTRERGDEVSDMFAGLPFLTAADLVLDFAADRKRRESTLRCVEVRKSRVAEAARGDELWLDWRDGRYVEASKPAPAPQADRRKPAAELAAAVAAFREGNPDVDRRSALAHFGVTRGGGTRYKAFCEAWPAR